MILKTKIEVNYNSGIIETTYGVVQGKLLSVGWQDSAFTDIGANYAYYDVDGKQILQAGFNIQGEQIQALYDVIKGSIPEGLSYREEEEYKYYLAFVYQMAQTFSIPTTDIEIIAE